jgi:hypothetical protein
MHELHTKRKARGSDEKTPEHLALGHGRIRITLKVYYIHVDT